MFLILILVHLLLLINTQFTLWPEMVVYPYLLNNNFKLYSDIINPYPPTISYLLAFITQIFGYKPQVFQILTWGIILTIDSIIFVLSKKIIESNFKAYLSIIVFIIFSIPFGVNGLWFDLIQTPFILLSFYFYYLLLTSKKNQTANSLLSFSFLTIAFFIKQQVIWIFFLYIIYQILFFKRKDLVKLPFILSPGLLVFIILLCIFYKQNTLGEFLWWNIYFPFFKATQSPGYILLPSLKQIIVIVSLAILILPILFQSNHIKKFIFFFALISFMFAYPRFDYFHLIPTLSLISLVMPSALRKTRKYFIAPIAISVIIILSFSLRSYFKYWGQDIRFFEKDVLQAASLIQKINNPQNSIYIQNGPDQILPLSGQLPVKPWVDEFPWYFEKQNLEDQVINGIKMQNPRYVIYKSYEEGAKFNLGSYRPEKLAVFLEDNFKNKIQMSQSLWLKEKKENNEF